MLELNKLYNMDCMQGMKEFPDGFFDLAIVDPPYGIGIDGQKKRVCGNPKHNRKEHIRKSWDKTMLRQDAIVEEAVPEMLKAGGAVMQKAQQEEIKTRFNSRRSTGALLASIKVSAVKEIDGGKRVEIYPNGKDKHGVRNAEKGFVLNYGRSNMPARPWFTAANEKAADDVVSEMRRVWEEKQNEER